ncbi:DUF6049 family protein [Acidithrix sp. C25]|uniref:DUF6049 family protein n=1 Tax=Acidithrix sp. C25 TaxID=1671482 RepID=UPI00191BABD6|nr:DUF6049 family protein [Acidithrix sp. C25]
MALSQKFNLARILTNRDNYDSRPNKLNFYLVKVRPSSNTYRNNNYSNNSRLRTKAFGRLLTSIVFLATFFTFGTIFVGPIASSSAAAAETSPSITVTAGPSIAHLGSGYVISIKVTNAPSHSAIEGLLYPKLQNRSELKYLNNAGSLSYPIAFSRPVSVPGNQTATSTLVIPISFTAPGSASSNKSGFNLDLTDCANTCDGVYPLVITMIHKGATIASHAIPIAILSPAVPSTVPLGLGLNIDLTSLKNANAIPVISELAKLLSTYPTLSLTLSFSAQTLEVIKTSKSQSAHQALRTIASWASQPNHQILINSVTPLNLVQLDASNLLSYIAQDSALASKIASQVGLTPATSPKIFVTQGPLDNSALSALANDGFHQVVTAGNNLDLPDLKYTLTAGLRIPQGASSPVSILSQDPKLKQDLQKPSNAFEKSNFTISDLVSVFEDQPNDSTQRIMSLTLPVNSSNQIAVANDFLGSLSGAKVIKIMTLGQAFDALNSAKPKAQWLETSLTRQRHSQIANLATFNKTAIKLAATKSALINKKLADPMTLWLMEALSSNNSQSQNQSLLANINSSITKIFSGVSLPSNRTVTLTSNNASVPISVTSHSHVGLMLRLGLSSDRLNIPNGNNELVKVVSATNTATFVISTKTLGIFSAKMTLSTPKGNLEIASTQVVFRSLTFSTVGSLLTILALLTLGFWWLRTLFRGRSRNQNLIPRQAPQSQVESKDQTEPPAFDQEAALQSDQSSIDETD